MNIQFFFLECYQVPTLSAPKRVVKNYCAAQWSYWVRLCDPINSASICATSASMKLAAGFDYINQRGRHAPFEVAFGASNRNTDNRPFLAPTAASQTAEERLAAIKQMMDPSTPANVEMQNIVSAVFNAGVDERDLVD